MTARAAISMSPFAAELLTGPRRRGFAIGHGYALFDDDVIAITRPGEPRMPNGIETDLVLSESEPVWIGEGEFRTTSAALTAGPIWQPRPDPRYQLCVRPRPQLHPDFLAGRGPGLTPLGDDVLIGYLAGAVLAGAETNAISLAAERAGRRTTTLSRTLLRLAAQAQLPEPAHRLLEHGDPQPLINFGATSGKGIALGLCLPDDDQISDGCDRQTITLVLPFPSTPTRFSLAIAPRDCAGLAPRSRRGALE